MFWALVAPELVLAWYVAGKIADSYNDKKGEVDKTTSKSLDAQNFTLRNENTRGLGNHMVLREEQCQR